MFLPYTNGGVKVMLVIAAILVPRIIFNSVFGCIITQFEVEFQTNSMTSYELRVGLTIGNATSSSNCQLTFPIWSYE